MVLSEWLKTSVGTHCTIRLGRAAFCSLTPGSGQTPSSLALSSGSQYGVLI
jgi:hypothetical protein